MSERSTATKVMEVWKAFQSWRPTELKHGGEGRMREIKAMRQRPQALRPGRVAECPYVQKTQRGFVFIFEGCHNKVPKTR